MSQHLASRLVECKIAAIRLFLLGSRAGDDHSLELPLIAQRPQSQPEHSKLPLPDCPIGKAYQPRIRLGAGAAPSAPRTKQSNRRRRLVASRGPPRRFSRLAQLSNSLGELQRIAAPSFRLDRFSASNIRLIG